jgi:hypothetical protein
MPLAVVDRGCDRKRTWHTTGNAGESQGSALAARADRCARLCAMGAEAEAIMGQHLGRSAVVQITPAIIADNTVAWVRSHPTWHWQDVPRTTRGYSA